MMTKITEHHPPMWEGYLICSVIRQLLLTRYPPPPTVGEGLNGCS